MAAAVFLDRDGVLNKKMPDGEYVTCPAQLRLLPGAVEAIRRLKEAGYLVFIVTNQRGIARGLFTMEDLQAVHKVLLDALHQASTAVDGIYVCPHEKGVCNCRKPKPGLLLQAKSDFPQLDFAKSVMIGDSESDMQAGQAAGCGTLIKIGTPPALSGYLSAELFVQAVDLIIKTNRSSAIE